MARPIWVISYEGEEISSSIAPMVTGVSYTDHVHGKSDEVELVVEDGDRRWRNLWYPSEGDRIDLKIGWEGQPLLNCGQFEIDEIETQHSPRAATIRGLAVPISAPLRTAVSTAYEDTTLREIVESIASARGLTVVGTIEEIPFRRVTQAHETDVGFLRRLAERFGYAFSVRGEQLVFYRLLDLEAEDPVLTIGESDLLPGSVFRGKAQDTYAACELTYFDPETGTPISVRVEADGVKRQAGAPVQATAPTSPPDVVLRRGSPYREEVRDWQRFLQGRGQYTGALDGIFGALTERGTRAFQADAGIGVDGVVGPITYQAAIDAGFMGGAGAPGGASSVGDVLRITERVESAAEAEARALAALHRANRLRVGGTMKIEGNQRAVSGSTINLIQAGRLSGGYLIDKSVHRINVSQGYQTECEVNHVL